MINAFVIGILVVSSLFLIVFVLLHSGKGGGLSDMFGGGMGLSGGTTVEKNLDRLTIITAVVWGTATLWLAWKWT